MLLPSTFPQVSWTGVSHVVLGSRSWSRKTLLQQLSPPPLTLTAADINEEAAAAASNACTARDTVLSIGLAKLRAVLPFHVSPGDGSRRGVKGVAGRTLVICGDAVVTHGDAILGKPATVDAARALLRTYHMAPVTTVSSLVVADAEGGAYWAGIDEAEVYFHALPDAVIEAMLADGGMESAGALRIEHAAVQPFIDCIVGDLSAVMGFSQPLCARLVAAALDDNDAGTPLSV